MTLPAFLILFPLVPAVLLALIPGDGFRKWTVRISLAALAAGSVMLAASLWGLPSLSFEMSPGFGHGIASALEGLLYILMLWGCRRIKANEFWIPLVILVQAVWLGYLEFGTPLPEVTHPLALDGLSAIMALVIGVVGSMCVLDAVGYMKDYHHHHTEVKDGRRWFFPVLFLFLASMFLIVFSNHLLWLLVGWEATTFFSFVLIGYSGDETAVRNSFRALGLNALGGLAFVAALHYLTAPGGAGTLELDQLGVPGSAALVLPALLLGVAGMAKAAQMPFSSWLLGAMVAPTPVSALLHSSTMVKAGVYLLLRMAPVFHGTMVGDLTALVGGVTFLGASLAAVSQSNAKRVLAYSTIANLGLITACAGVGTHEALWAAFLLIVFHAVSKALLFLAVGAVEHQIGSRSIEDMDGLVVKHKALAVMILLGMMGMFVAPFGVLISKWACLVAFYRSQPLLAILLAYGSAPTLFFWAKWMGKITSVPGDSKEEATGLSRDEWTALGTLAFLTAAIALLYQPLASGWVEPLLIRIYGASDALGPLSGANGLLLTALLALMIVFPILYALFPPPKSGEAKPYLSGLNAPGGVAIRGLHGDVRVESRSLYLDHVFKETLIMGSGLILTVALLAAATLKAVMP